MHTASMCQTQPRFGSNYFDASGPGPKYNTPHDRGIFQKPHLLKHTTFTRSDRFAYVDAFSASRGIPDRCSPGPGRYPASQSSFDKHVRSTERLKPGTRPRPLAARDARPTARVPPARSSRVARAQTSARARAALSARHFLRADPPLTLSAVSPRIRSVQSAGQILGDAGVPEARAEQERAQVVELCAELWPDRCQLMATCVQQCARLPAMQHTMWLCVRNSVARAPIASYRVVSHRRVSRNVQRLGRGAGWFWFSVTLRAVAGSVVRTVRRAGGGDVRYTDQESSAPGCSAARGMIAITATHDPSAQSPPPRPGRGAEPRGRRLRSRCRPRRRGRRRRRAPS